MTVPLILPLTVNIFGVKQVKRYKGSFSLEKVTSTHIPTHNRCISDKICSVGSKQGQSYLHIGNLTKFKVYLKKKLKTSLIETWVYFVIQHGRNVMKSERDTNKFLGFSKISKTHLFELHFTSNNTKVSIKTETGSHLIYSTFLVTPFTTSLSPNK